MGSNPQRSALPRPPAAHGDLAVNPKKFLTELKRRNVYKVAIAYGVVAWLLMQCMLGRGQQNPIRLTQSRTQSATQDSTAAHIRKIANERVPAFITFTPPSTLCPFMDLSEAIWAQTNIRTKSRFPGNGQFRNSHLCGSRQPVFGIAG